MHSILDPRGVWDTTALYARGRAIPTIQRAQAAIEALGTQSPFMLVYYGSDGGGGWQPLDEPLRTVTTLDRFALVEKIRGEYRMRMLQPSELARAMGLPKNHKFNHGKRQWNLRTGYEISYHLAYPSGVQGVKVELKGTDYYSSLHGLTWVESISIHIAIERRGLGFHRLLRLRAIGPPLESASSLHSPFSGSG